MRTQAADKPFEEDLEDGSGDQAVEETNDCIIGVPERADANLHEQNEEDRYQRAEKRSEPNWNDFFAERVAVMQFVREKKFKKRFWEQGAALTQIEDRLPHRQKR